MNSLPEGPAKLLTHLRTAPQRTSMENYLRGEFGDTVLDQAHKGKLVTRSPKGLYTITLRGKEALDIASKLGVHFDGVQEGIGLQFTDIAQTGTTFYGNTLAEAKASLDNARRKFAIEEQPSTQQELPWKQSPGIPPDTMTMQDYEKHWMDPVSQSSYSDLVKDNQEQWKAAWEDLFGADAVIYTEPRWDGLVKHLGYKAVHIAPNARETLGLIIPTDKSVVMNSQERLKDVKIVPDSQLTERQLTHLNLARAISDTLMEVYGLSAVHAAIIPPASDRVRTAGLYQTSTKEVFIAADQLESGKRTIDTLIHELAHHVSRAEDLEPKHSDKMTSIAASVVELASGRGLDRWLREVKWHE